MIEDTPIVRDTRKVRCAISERFAHDSDKYIDYLLRKSNTKEYFSFASSAVKDADRASTECTSAEIPQQLETR